MQRSLRDGPHPRAKLEPSPPGTSIVVVRGIVNSSGRERTWRTVRSCAATVVAQASPLLVGMPEQIEVRPGVATAGRPEVLALLVSDGPGWPGYGFCQPHWPYRYHRC